MKGCIWVHLLEKLLSSSLKPEALHLEALLAQFLVLAIELFLDFRELAASSKLFTLLDAFLLFLIFSSSAQCPYTQCPTVFVLSENRLAVWYRLCSR